MISLDQFPSVLSNVLNGNGKESFLISVSLHELPFLAQAIADALKPGDWVLLDGDLGTGKTALVSAIGKKLGLKNNATSPTFSLIQTESIQGNESGIERFIHLDLYRLKSDNELIYLGLENEFVGRKSLVFIEWPHQVDEEGFKNFFNVTNCQKPKRALEIEIELEENNSRVYLFRKSRLGEKDASD